MNRILSLLFFLISSHLLHSQVQILSYDVNVSFDEQRSQLSGSAAVVLRTLEESLSSLSIHIPGATDIVSIETGTRRLDSKDQIPSGTGNTSILRLSFTEKVKISDSIRLTIEFSSLVDSTTLSSSFISGDNLFFLAHDSASWLPFFGQKIINRYSLEINTSDAFLLFSDSPFDTVTMEGLRIWKRSSVTPAPFSSAFTFYGFRTPAVQRILSADSTISVSLVYPSGTLNHLFAQRLTLQLNDAVQYFSTITRQRSISSFSLALMRHPVAGVWIYNSPLLGIRTLSPAFFLYDSNATLTPSQHDIFFMLAQRFCPVSTDSTAIFRFGIASYLTLRYHLSRNPSDGTKERFHSISEALTFFPSGTLIEGTTSPFNTENYLSHKGKYFFLMLEYILGSDGMDAVIAESMSRFFEAPISFSGFQRICEDQYGSSLHWFFEQWLTKPSAPEFVIQWRYEKTQRGMYVVKTQIEQRNDLYVMPVPLVFSFGGRTIIKRAVVDQVKQELTFVFPTPPTSVELDPDYSILRWLLDIRISAHANSALQYLTITGDTVHAEQEAMYTLQLDPNNSTGSAPLAYYVLGTISASRKDFEKAKEYFLKSVPAAASSSMEKYKLMSMINIGIIRDLEGRRNDAISLYQRVIIEGKKNLSAFEPVMIKAEQYVREPFTSASSSWIDFP